VGALVPSCRLFHVDSPRVYARDRDGMLTLSCPARRRPTLLGLTPPGAERVTTLPCPRHGTPVLRPR
jgi:hypothetical protein